MDDDIATFDFAKKSVMMGAGFQGMPGTPPSHRARGVYAAGNRAFHLKRNYMKRSLAMRLLSALLVVFPITIMQAEDAIVEDTDASAAISRPSAGSLSLPQCARTGKQATKLIPFPFPFQEGAPGIRNAICQVRGRSVGTTLKSGTSNSHRPVDEIEKNECLSRTRDVA
jgi:hypothetical protein